MKKAFLGLAVLFIAAITVFGFSGQTMASEQTDGGPGSALLFTYYDVRSAADGGLGLTDNYFTIINTSTTWVQSHVRIRTGGCSVELLDFDIMQSPKDVFVFDIYQDGGITFASCDSNTLTASGFNLNFDADGDGDNDCFVLSSVTFPDMLSLIMECGDCATGAAYTEAQAIQKVKKGYVEVIEEGLIFRKSTKKDQCASETSDPPTILIPGSTLRDLYADPECHNDIWAPEAELQGKQYFVQVDTSVSPVVISRHAQANAAVIDYDPDSGLILHENNYTDELAAAECNAADGSEHCYAYAAPKTTDAINEVAVGANDLNWCFYVNKIGDDAVVNKFGAAATFGPTLADIDERRNGSLAQTATNITEAMDSGSLASFDLVESEFDTEDDEFMKQYVDSHYFFAPAPGPYNVKTAFAFIFPLKHFIGEKESIAAKEIYDNSENTVTVDIGKFISPGLPTAATFADEANIFFLSPSFNEGWIRFEVSATNSTTGCADLYTGSAVDCEVEGYDIFGDANALPSTKYVPAYMGLTFTSGAQTVGASPFTYNNSDLWPQDNGQFGDSR